MAKFTDQLTFLFLKIKNTAYSVSTLTHYIPNWYQNMYLGSPGEDQICNSKAWEEKK